MTNSPQPKRREFLTFFCGLTLAGLTGCGGASGGSPNPPPPVKPTTLLIPAYFFDPLLWQRILPAHAPAHDLIVNINSGPGTSDAAVWRARFDQARANGHALIGYIDTAFAKTDKKTAASIQTEIGLWKSLYGITDIFFDQVSSLRDDLPYYTKLVTSIRATLPEARVLLNCGAVPEVGYFSMDALTEVVVFEDSWEAFQRLAFPAMLTPYWPRAHVIVHTAPRTALSSVHNFAGEHGAAGYFVTDAGTMGYTLKLPDYWDAELAL